MPYSSFPLSISMVSLGGGLRVSPGSEGGALPPAASPVKRCVQRANPDSPARPTYVGLSRNLWLRRKVQPAYRPLESHGQVYIPSTYKLKSRIQPLQTWKMLSIRPGTPSCSVLFLCRSVQQVGKPAPPCGPFQRLVKFRAFPSTCILGVRQ